MLVKTKLVIGLMSFSALGASAETVGRVIVKFRPDSVVVKDSSSERPWSPGVSGRLAQRLDNLASRSGAPLVQRRALGGQTVAASSTGMPSAQLAALLAKHADVAYAAVDQLRFPRAIPTDPLYAASESHPVVAAGQWYTRAPSETTPAAINAESAWNKSYVRPVSVAVLDSGVRRDHEDLDAVLLSGYNMISDPIRAGWPSTFGRTSDPSDNGDWLEQSEIDRNPTSYPRGQCYVFDSSSWHGTSVSSVIAASVNNGLGMAGLSPTAKVVPVRVLGKCGGFDSDIIAGMRWAAGLAVDGELRAVDQPRARVINMSLGVEGACSDAYVDAMNDMTQRGVVVVAAAGNNAGGPVESPANCPGVIAVGALRHVGTKVGYSAIGSGITISAPGGNCVNTDGGPCLYPILVASNRGVTTPVPHESGGSIYSEGVGTSFAVPMVSGTAALMLSLRPALSPENIRHILMATARPFPQASSDSPLPVCQPASRQAQEECHCTSETCGAGMLDVARAVAMAEGAPLIRVTPDAPNTMESGQTWRLDASGSLPGLDASRIERYQWRLLQAGAGVEQLGGDVSQPTITVTTQSAGRFIIQLTITDDSGASATESRTYDVKAPSRARSSGGGGGGGGVDHGVLVMLALMWLGVAVFTRKGAQTRVRS